MILLCECEWIFSHFLRFCADAREYFEKNSLKNRIVGEKNFGESRTGGAVASLRDPKRNLVQNYFPVTRGPWKKFPRSHRLSMRICEKFSRPRRPRKDFPDRDAYRTRKTIVLLPQRGGGNGPPGPLRLEGVRGSPMPGTLFVIAENFGFLAAGFPSRCGSWAPMPGTLFVIAENFGFLAMRPPMPGTLFVIAENLAPLLRRTHGKKIGCVCMPGTHFVITKTSTLLQNFLSIDTRARHTFHKGPKNFTCSPQIFSLLS